MWNPRISILPGLDVPRHVSILQCLLVQINRESSITFPLISLTPHKQPFIFIGVFHEAQVIYNVGFGQPFIGVLHEAQVIYNVKNVWKIVTGFSCCSTFSLFIKGLVDCFFSLHDCVYGVQNNMYSWFFLF